MFDLVCCSFSADRPLLLDRQRAAMERGFVRGLLDRLGGRPALQRPLELRDGRDAGHGASTQSSMPESPPARC
jgi:hypothetical protein